MGEKISKDLEQPDTVNTKPDDVEVFKCFKCKKYKSTKQLKQVLLRGQLFRKDMCTNCYTEITSDVENRGIKI